MKKRVFISSSTEAKTELDLVARWLQAEGLEPVPWNSIHEFIPGRYVLPRLIEISKEVDGAALIFTPDDKTRHRGANVLQPRDNVMLEYGLFARALGPEAAIICQSGSTRIASDLHGLTLVKLSTDNDFQAKAVFANWAKKLREPFPRIALHCSETTEVAKSELLRNSYKIFCRTLLNELFRWNIGINTCGTPSFLQVVYEFFNDEFLKPGGDLGHIQSHSNRIRWYWHSGARGGVSYAPPIFESRQVRNEEERTIAEVNDSDLVVAVSGKVGTVRQLELILYPPPDVDSILKRKQVLVTGWFGGDLHDYIRRSHPPSQKHRIITEYEGVDFSALQQNWKDQPERLARDVAKTIHALVSIKKRSTAL